MINGYFSYRALRACALLLGASALIYGCSGENKTATAPKAEQQAQTALASSQGAGQKAAQDNVALGKEHFDKGFQLSLAQKYDEAIKEYEETVKYDPQSGEAYNNLGFAYYDKNDWDKAVEYQKKAIEVNPSLANAYFGLAMALEKKGDNAGALTNWKQFLKMSQPHSKWWMKAQEHIKKLEPGKAPAQKKS